MPASVAPVSAFSTVTSSAVLPGATGVLSVSTSAMPSGSLAGVPVVPLAPQSTAHHNFVPRAIAFTKAMIQKIEAIFHAAMAWLFSVINRLRGRPLVPPVPAPAPVVVPPNGPNRVIQTLMSPMPGVPALPADYVNLAKAVAGANMLTSPTTTDSVIAAQALQQLVPRDSEMSPWDQKSLLLTACHYPTAPHLLALGAVMRAISIDKTPQVALNQSREIVLLSLAGSVLSGHWAGSILNTAAMASGVYALFVSRNDSLFNYIRSRVRSVYNSAVTVTPAQAFKLWQHMQQGSPSTNLVTSYNKLRGLALQSSQGTPYTGAQLRYSEFLALAQVAAQFDPVLAKGMELADKRATARANNTLGAVAMGTAALSLAPLFVTNTYGQVALAGVVGAVRYLAPDRVHGIERKVTDITNRALARMGNAFSPNYLVDVYGASVATRWVVQTVADYGGRAFGFSTSGIGATAGQLVIGAGLSVVPAAVKLRERIVEIKDEENTDTAKAGTNQVAVACARTKARWAYADASMDAVCSAASQGLVYYAVKQTTTNLTGSPELGQLLGGIAIVVAGPKLAKTWSAIKYVASGTAHQTANIASKTTSAVGKVWNALPSFRSKRALTSLPAPRVAASSATTTPITAAVLSSSANLASSPASMAVSPASVVSSPASVATVALPATPLSVTASVAPLMTPPFAADKTGSSQPTMSRGATSPSPEGDGSHGLGLLSVS